MCFLCDSKNAAWPGRRAFLLAAAGSAAAAAAFPALAQVDVGKASQLRNLVPADELENAATQEYSKTMAEARSKGALAEAGNPQLQRLRTIAAKLVPQTGQWNDRAKSWKWEVNLIGSKQINAFCMPGGKIAFYTGILDQLKLTDDEVGSIEELRGNLTSNFQKEIDDKNKQNKETAILNELLNHINVEIPETLLDRELNFMLNQTATQLQQQGMDIRQIFTQEMIPALKERSRPEAIDRIKRTLALGEVAKLEAIQIDNVVLATRIQETLAELKNENVDPKRLREVLTEELLKETILGWLEENWTIELVPEGTLTPIEREFDDDYDDEDDDDDDDVIEVDAIEA